MADLASLSPLNNIPDDIQFHRQRLFALDTLVQMTPAVFERYWRYMDNVWCRQQRNNLSLDNQPPGPVMAVEKHYGVCRLYRSWKLTEVPENSRRTRRVMATCKAKFRIMVYSDGMRVVERTGPPHSHDLDHLDAIKRNSGVRNIVLSDFFKTWEHNAILAYLKDTTHRPDGRDILKEAGGLHLNRQEVSNIIVGALKKAYPGQEISEVRKQMDKYKNLHVCSWKGCDVPPFENVKELLEHRKAVHGTLTHDHSHKHYICPEKTCWRHKKSKGFSTLEGLNDHLQKHHNSAVTPEQVVTLGLYKSGPDEPMPDFTPQDEPMTPATSTPHSEDPSAQLEQALGNSNDGSANAASSSNQVLSEAQRKSMTQRLASLEQQRTRLDAEIASLRRALQVPVPAASPVPAPAPPPAPAQTRNNTTYTSPYPQTSMT